jgi:PKD repeat protein
MRIWIIRLFLYLSVSSYITSTNANAINKNIRDTTLCKGDSVLLQSNFVGQSYEWYYMGTLIGNTSSVYAKSAGLFHSVVLDSNGTNYYDSVMVNYGAEANSNWGVDSIFNLSVTFMAYGTAGLVYLWDFDDPSSSNNTSQLPNPTHLFTSPGNRNVSLTTRRVISNCVSTTTQNINVPWGINTFKQNLNLKVFPNPLTQNSVLSYELKNESEVSIEVYNYLGQKLTTIDSITKQAPSTYNYSLANLAEYNAPMLLLKVMVDGMVVTELVTSH